MPPGRSRTPTAPPGRRTGVRPPARRPRASRARCGPSRAGEPMDPAVRRDVARYAAPAAFLVAITILVVLVHSALSSGGGDTTTAAQPATTHRTTTRATTTKPRATTTTTRSTTTTSTTTAGAQYYTIQSGDTFGSIAAAEGTTIGALEQLNPDVTANALSVAQQIRIKQRVGVRIPSRR